MNTALDVDSDFLDDDERDFVDNVRTHGWVGTHIPSDDEGPGFSYTTGFWHRLNVPELFVFSLPHKAAYDIFWWIYSDIEGGKGFPQDKPVSGVLKGFDVVLKKVPLRHYRDHFGWGRWFYRGDSFEVLQIIWPDKSNRFPWEKEFSTRFRELQPVLSGPVH